MRFLNTAIRPGPHGEDALTPARDRALTRPVFLFLSADPKIVHNEAVSQYVLNGSGDPRKLLAVLERLKQRADDAQSDAGEGSLADVADVDPSLTAYNTAVLLYQLKQYSRCRAILEEMFSNIEPVDEFLVFRVCFLLLDVYLLQKQAEKTTEVRAADLLRAP